MKKTVLSVVAAFVISSLNANEIARYKLDGNANDSGVRAFNGVISGSVYGVRDRFNNSQSAMQFSNGLIKINAFKSYAFGDKLSISFWMRRDSVDNYMGLINNGFTTKSFDIRMGRESGGTFLFSKSDWTSGATSVSSSNFISIGQWHHIAYVADSGLARLYIDGMLQMERVIAAGTLKAVSSPVIFGTNAYGLTHEPFNGALDDVWMFDHALSESEVKSIYNNSYTPGTGITVTNTGNIGPFPNSGGTLSYIANINNSSNTNSINVQNWTIITFPTGEDLAVSTPVSLDILPLETVNLTEHSVNIPSWWPAGQYTLRTYTSEANKPNGNIQSAYFTFSKSN